MIALPLGNKFNILLWSFKKKRRNRKQNEKLNTSAGRPLGDFSDHFRVPFSWCLNHHILRFSGGLLTSLLKKIQNFLNQVCFENVFGWLAAKSGPFTHLALQNMTWEGKPGGEKRKNVSPKAMCLHFSLSVRNHLKCYFHHITFHHVFARIWTVRAYTLIPAMPFT